MQSIFLQPWSMPRSSKTLWLADGPVQIATFHLSIRPIWGITLKFIMSPLKATSVQYVPRFVKLKTPWASISRGINIETAVELNYLEPTCSLKTLTSAPQAYRRSCCNTWAKLLPRSSYAWSVNQYRGAQKHHVLNHIEAKHIKVVIHTCDVCGRQCPTRNALYAHKSRTHRWKELAPWKCNWASVCP